MDWTQTLTIILPNLGILLVLFVYLMGKIDSNKKELDQKIDQFQKEVSSKFNKVVNRLTAIEVEIKNTQQRLSVIEGYLISKKIYRIEEPSSDEPKEN